jgi:hypothetical protein
VWNASGAELASSFFQRAQMRQADEHNVGNTGLAAQGNEGIDGVTGLDDLLWE